MVVSVNNSNSVLQIVYSMIGFNSVGLIMWDDVIWILISFFIIFIMQLGWLCMYCMVVNGGVIKFFFIVKNLY